MNTQLLIDEALDMKEWAIRKALADARQMVGKFADHAAATGEPLGEAYEQGKQWYMASKDTLKNSETFVWTKECQQRVLAASKKLDDTVPFHRAWLPVKAGFWWLGRDSQWDARCDVQREFFPDLPERRKICAITFRVHDPSEHLLIEALTLDHREKTRGPTIFHGMSWMEGESLQSMMKRVIDYQAQNQQKYDDDASGWWEEAAETICRIMMAATLWLQQKVVSSPSFPASRPSRRRAQKAEMNTSTRIVLLRQSEPLAGSTPNPGTGKPLEYRIHVAAAKGGYWRNQYYPSTGETIPLWIEDYWRGPKGAPEKAPAKIIYKVSR